MAEIKERDEPETDAPEAEAPGREQEDDTDARARAAGWVDKDEYRGDPDEWVPAKEWLSYTPAKLRKHNRTLERRIASMDRTLEVISKRQEEMQKRANEEALKRIRERQKAAAQDGDMDTYEDLEKERDKLREPEAKAPPPERTGDLDPAIVEWADRNPWIVNDPVNMAEAHALSQRFARDHPTAALSDRLEMISKEMTRRYARGADDNGTRETRTKRPSMVETNARSAARSAPKRTTYSDLTAEEKTQIRALERKGLIGNGEHAMFKTRDEYAAYMRDYYGEETVR